VLGKHTKRIKCGCWSKQNLLALASDDRSLSVSNSDGDTLRQFSLQGDPSDLQFSEMKADERSNIGENTASSVGDNSIGLAAAAALSWLLSSLSTHADRQGVDISFTVCFCVCVFVRLRISPPRIKIAVLHFARRFVGVKAGNHKFL